VLAEHLAKTPDRMTSRYRRSIDFLLLGAVLGGTLGAIGIASETMSGKALQSPRGLLTAAGFSRSTAPCSACSSATSTTTAGAPDGCNSASAISCSP
jgi:hypothetical protein